MNGGNFLTFEILKKSAGLTFSPTIIGSIIIMLGIPGLFIFSFFIAILIWVLDALFKSSIPNGVAGCQQPSAAGILVGTYCVSIMFYFVSLIRDGVDTFFSRLFFFTAFFLFATLCALALTFILQNTRTRADTHSEAY